MVVFSQRLDSDIGAHFQPYWFYDLHNQSKLTMALQKRREDFFGLSFPRKLETEGTRVDAKIILFLNSGHTRLWLLDRESENCVVHGSTQSSRTIITADHKLFPILGYCSASVSWSTQQASTKGYPYGSRKRTLVIFFLSRLIDVVSDQ